MMISSHTRLRDLSLYFRLIYDLTSLFCRNVYWVWINTYPRKYVRNLKSTDKSHIHKSMKTEKHIYSNITIDKTSGNSALKEVKRRHEWSSKR